MSYVQKPIMCNGEYFVIIKDRQSPLAKEIDRVPCGTNNREKAWQVYRRVKKERGEML